MNNNTSASPSSPQRGDFVSPTQSTRTRLHRSTIDAHLVSTATVNQRALLSPLNRSAPLTPPPNLSTLGPHEQAKWIGAATPPPPPIAKLQHDLVALQRRLASEKRAKYLAGRGLNPAEAGVTSTLAELRAATEESRLPSQEHVVRRCLDAIRAADTVAAMNASAELSEGVSLNDVMNDVSLGHVNLECLDVNLPDFVVICYALSAARNVRSIDLNGANLTPAHFRVLVDCAKKRSAMHPIMTITLDEGIESSPQLGPWCARLYAVVEERAAAYQRETTAQDASASITDNQSPRNATSVVAVKRREEISRRRGNILADEKTERASIDASHRSEMAKIRNIFKRVHDTIVALNKLQRRQKFLAQILLTVVDAEARSRATIEASARAAIVEMLTKQGDEHRAATAAEERRVRRSLWVDYSLNFEVSQRNRANRLNGDRLDRLNLTLEHLIQRGAIVEERWKQYKEMHTEHVNRVDVLRKQQQSAWLSVNTTDEPADRGEHGKRRVGGGAVTNAMKDKMDDLIKQKCNLVAAQELAARSLITHHADGEEALERQVLLTVCRSILATSSANQAVQKWKHNFESVYSLPPLLRLWVPANAAHPAVFETLPATDADPTAVVNCCSAVQVNVDMPPGWSSSVTALWSQWRRVVGTARAALPQRHDDVTAACEALDHWKATKIALQQQQNNSPAPFHTLSAARTPHIQALLQYWNEHVDHCNAALNLADAGRSPTDAPLPDESSEVEPSRMFPQLQEVLQRVVRGKLSARSVQLHITALEGGTADQTTRTTMGFDEGVSSDEKGRPFPNLRVVTPSPSHTISMEVDCRDVDFTATDPKQYLEDAIGFAVRHVTASRYSHGSDTPFQVVVDATLHVPTVLHPRSTPPSGDAAATQVSTKVNVAYCVFPPTIRLDATGKLTHTPVVAYTPALTSSSTSLNASTTEVEQLTSMTRQAAWVTLMPNVSLQPQPNLYDFPEDLPTTYELAFPSSVSPCLLSPVQHEAEMRRLAGDSTIGAAAAKRRRQSIVNTNAAGRRTSMGGSQAQMIAAPLAGVAATLPRLEGSASETLLGLQDFTHHIVEVEKAPSGRTVTLSQVVVTWACVACDKDDQLFLLQGDAPFDDLSVANHIVRQRGVRIATTSLLRGFSTPSEGGPTSKPQHGMVFRLTFEGDAVAAKTVANVMRLVAFRNTAGAPLLGQRKIACRLLYASAENNASEHGSPIISTIPASSRRKSTFFFGSPRRAGSTHGGAVSVMEDSVSVAFLDQILEANPDESTYNLSMRSNPCDASSTSFVMPYEAVVTVDVQYSECRPRWTFEPAEAREWFALVDDPSQLSSELLRTLKPAAVSIAPHCSIIDHDTVFFQGGTLVAEFDDDIDPGDTADHLGINLPIRMTPEAATVIVPDPLLETRYSSCRDVLALVWAEDGLAATLECRGAVVGCVQRTVSAIPSTHQHLVGGATQRCRKIELILTNAVNVYTWHVHAVSELVRSLTYCHLNARPLAGAESTPRLRAISLEFRMGQTTGRRMLDGSMYPTSLLQQGGETLKHQVHVARHHVALLQLTTCGCEYIENSGDAPLVQITPDTFNSVPPLPNLSVSASPTRRQAYRSLHGATVTVGLAEQDTETLDAIKLDLPEDEYSFKKVAAHDAEVVFPTAATALGTLKSRFNAENGAAQRARADGATSTLMGDAAVLTIDSDRGFVAAAVRERHVSSLASRGIVCAVSKLLPSGTPQTFEVWPAAASPSSAAAVAQAVAVRGGDLCLTFAPDVTVTPQLVSTFINSVRYSNSDRNPCLLTKRGRLRIRHAHGSESLVLFTIAIKPVDDPTEIALDLPAPSITYRPGTTEREPWSKALCRIVGRYRDRFKDLQPIAKVFPESSHGSQEASSSIETMNATPRIGVLPLLPADRVNIDDPDTDTWDGGCIVVRCASGWLPCCRVDLMTVEQQRLLWSTCPSVSKFLLTTDAASGELFVCREPEKDETLREHIGRVVLHPHRRASLGGRGGRGGRGAKADANAPLNDAGDDDEATTGSALDPGTAFGYCMDDAPTALVTSGDGDGAVEAIRIEFRTPRFEGAEETIDLSVVRYVLYCLSFWTAHDMGPREVMSTLKFEIAVNDRRSSTPGVAALTVDLHPRVFSCPMAESPNLASITQWRQMSVDAPVPYNLVLAYSTRTTTAPTGGEPVLPTFNVNVNEKDKLKEGTYLEIFFSQGQQPKDALSFKFAGTNFVATSDGFLVFGREGNVGRLFASPHYIRMDVPTQTKATTFKRLQQLLRCLYFRIDADSRDNGIVVGDRTLTIALCDGRRDSYDRLECTVAHFIITVQDLPPRRD